MRALLVEPDEATREQVRASLERRGWQVTLAADPGEGARVFAAAPFPLVVLACEQPEGDELSLCREIRDSASGRAAYVLVTTGCTLPEVVEGVVEAGADDYLPAPFSPDRLEARLALAEAHLRAASEGAGPRRTSFHQRIVELEHSLHVEQSTLEQLFQSAPDGIAVVDGEDRVVRLNGEFSRMFGYPAAEALGRPVNELIVPAHLAAEGLRITRAVQRGERVEVDTVRRHRDGRLIDVALRATPIRIGAGRIGAFAMYRDITAHRAADAALRESEQRYRALFDQSPVGVFLCDREMRITHCNRQLLRSLRATARQIVGMKLTEVEDARILGAVQSALAGKAALYEGPYRATTTGAQLWISARISPLRNGQGEVMGSIAVIEDTTEREHAGQRMRAQAAELERVNAALRERTLQLEAAMQARSRLYTAMNHELRTPISAIMLYQELFLSGTLGPLSTEQTQALQHTQTAAHHLLELVRDVLDLSKIEAGKVSIHPVEVSVPALLHGLLATVLPLARHYGSELHLTEDVEPLTVVTDPQRVRQILLNFISNAAKYGRARPIRMRYAPRGRDEVVIEVEDQGVGIDAADLPRIFEDFVQVGWQEGGTGLGLAISRRLADLLEGRLEVDSQLGVGSTFRLVLPRSHPSSLPPT